MPELNLHHLRYFWAVVREGSLAAASRRLRLTPATVSAQLRRLEAAQGVQLLQRRGRVLEPTELGRVVFRYADRVFTASEELGAFLASGATPAPRDLRVGVAHVLPKLVTWRLLAPALTGPHKPKLRCREASASVLVSELARHQLDVVLTDAPLRGEGIRLFNHGLGESPVVFLAAPALAKRLRRRFPHSLEGAPFVLPSPGTAMRQALDAWFDTEGIRPDVVAEFDDSSLLKVAGEHALGVMPVPQVVATSAKSHYGVRLVGTPAGVVERFYAVSAERQFDHPAVEQIVGHARALLRSSTSSLR